MSRRADGKHMYREIEEGSIPDELMKKLKAYEKKAEEGLTLELEKHEWLALAMGMDFIRQAAFQFAQSDHESMNELDPGMDRQSSISAFLEILGVCDKIREAVREGCQDLLAEGGGLTQELNEATKDTGAGSKPVEGIIAGGPMPEV